MKINRLIWLGEIIEKIERKHNVKQYEVREVFNRQSKFRFVEKGYRRDENVYEVMGQTRAGRYLIVFFIYKKDKSVLVLSARDMTHSERRKYEK